MKIDNAVHDFKHSDVSFIGLPIIKSRTPNKLSTKGPDLIRFALNNKDDFDEESGCNVFDKLRIHDAGDKKSIKGLAHDYSGQKLFILGGEHSITKNTVRELMKKVKNLHVIIFDAHLDARQEGEPNATFLRELIKSGVKISLVGQRVYNREELEYIKNKGLEILNSIDLKDENIYISFDVDVVDSVHVPTCSTPEPFGKSLEYYNNLLCNLIKSNNLIGIDFVEFAGEEYDITYSNTASIIMNLLKSLLNNK